jgi:hypothetical protein
MRRDAAAACGPTLLRGTGACWPPPPRSRSAAGGASPLAYPLPAHPVPVYPHCPVLHTRRIIPHPPGLGTSFLSSSWYTQTHSQPPASTSSVSLCTRLSRREWPGQGGGCGECVRVRRYIVSNV